MTRLFASLSIAPIAAILLLALAACGGSPGRDKLSTDIPGQPSDGGPAGPLVDPSLGSARDIMRPDRPGAIRIGLLLPLSGPAAEAGQAMLLAAQMALFDSGDKRLTLLPRDTGGSPEGATAAVEAVLDEGAEIILGPVFADAVRAVAPITRARRISVVAFSNDRTVAGDGVYLMGLLPEDQVTRVVNFAFLQGLRRFAVLAPDSPYGQRVIDSLREAAYANGAEVTQTVLYPANAGPGDEELLASVRQLADYDRRREELENQRRVLARRKDELSKLALKRLEGLDSFGELDYEAVLLADGGTRLTAVAPLLPFYDIDTKEIRVLGTALWDDPSITAEPALQGAWFAAPPPGGREAFRTRFQEVYGEKPPRIASLAYDALALAAVMVVEQPTDSAFGDRFIDIFGEQALTNASGFAGYDGIFRFSFDGTAERGLSILEVRGQGFEVVDPAPKTFEDAIN